MELLNRLKSKDVIIHIPSEEEIDLEFYKKHNNDKFYYYYDEDKVLGKHIGKIVPPMVRKIVNER